MRPPPGRNLSGSWRQHPAGHQLYGHLPPITKTVQVGRTGHAGHCWRSRDELIRDLLLWALTHGRAKAERPARTYIQQLCEDTGCCPEDLSRAMNDGEEWLERVRDIRATSTTWWWWYIYIYIYVCVCVCVCVCGCAEKRKSNYSALVCRYGLPVWKTIVWFCTTENVVSTFQWSHLVVLFELASSNKPFITELLYTNFAREFNF